MTQPLWPAMFEKMQVLVDDVSTRLLAQPISPWVEWIDQEQCSVKDTQPYIDALELINQTPQGVVLVLGRGRGIGGMVTRRPLLNAAVNRNDEVKVRDLFTPRNKIIEIDLKETMKTALVLFHQYSYRSLLVFDKGQNRVGVLKRSLLLKALIEQLISESIVRG
ncbi:MAG: CBS domain-containing protein [Candidatus Thiodiazotropha sp.]